MTIPIDPELHVLVSHLRAMGVGAMAQIDDRDEVDHSSASFAAGRAAGLFAAARTLERRRREIAEHVQREVSR